MFLIKHRSNLFCKYSIGQRIGFASDLSWKVMTKTRRMPSWHAKS
jgi:hypothetical protein